MKKICLSYGGKNFESGSQSITAVKEYTEKRQFDEFRKIDSIGNWTHDYELRYNIFEGTFIWRLEIPDHR